MTALINLWVYNFVGTFVFKQKTMEVSLLVFMMFINDVVAMFLFMMEVPESSIDSSIDILKNTEKYYRRSDLFWTKKMKSNVIFSTLYM